MEIGELKEMWLILSYEIKWCVLACISSVFLSNYKYMAQYPNEMQYYNLRQKSFVTIEVQ